MERLTALRHRPKASTRIFRALRALKKSHAERHHLCAGGPHCMSMPGIHKDNRLRLVSTEPSAGDILADLSLVEVPDKSPVLAVRPRAEPKIDPVAITHALHGRRALVVGINYAPEPTGIAPYTTGMAEHLARYADNVTVLTGMPHYPNWKLEPGQRLVFRSLQAGDDRSPTIRRLRHYVPGRQTAITRGWYEASFMLNAMATRHTAPDVVIAVTPSLGGAVAGAHLASRYGCKLIVVVQDLMARAARQSGISGGRWATNATAAIERYALMRADRVAVVSDSFRGQLLDYGVAPGRIRLLPNWTHILPTQLDPMTARRRLGWPTDVFTVVHTGNIGLKQDLGNMVAAARACSDDLGIRFVIVGDGSQRAAIETLGAGLPNLSFVEPLDDELYPVSLAAADLLVVNERPGVGDMSLPSKLTSYLSAGRPVLAAVHADGATAAELSRAAGAACIIAPGDPYAFVSSVQNLRSDPDACELMSGAGATYAQNFLSQANAFEQLDFLLKNILQPELSS